MRLKVEPDVIALSPGDVTDLLVRVHNDGEDACTPYLQVRGLDPDDVLLPDEVVAVPAGSVMTAVVRVRAAADAVPGDQRIAVAAEDLDGAQGTVSATTVLRIGARPDVAVEVDPVATAGRRGAKASTILRNRSDRRLQVELEGRGEGVLVSFRPSRITLDPGETKKVRTRMRRAQRSWFGEIRHGAVVTARGIGVPASTTATFTQKPSVPRPAVRGVAALTALAVWVAATVVVFNRINAEPEAGPDTGAVAAPAAPGPGRTSATGMFVEEEDEGVRLPVVIQGTIEGPRDPAGTTVTAERIGFGDQGTTSGFTKVVALAEVKLPRGNVLDVVRVTTDERGRFRIASGLVEDAFYRVTAVRAGFEVGSFIVSTSPEEPEVTLAIALEPASGSLAGTVTDADGAPVGGASVLVTDGSAEYTTVTPAEGELAGQWVLEGLATPATYQVVVSRRGFAAETLIVELDGGQNRTGVDATLVADLGTIVGRVTDASPDPNSPGVAQGVGALNVTLAGPEARETRTLTVDGDLRGTFDFPGLPFGDYQITFSGDGWTTRQAEVTVDSGLVRLDTTIDRSTGLVQGWVWQNATTDAAFQGECRYPRANQRDGAEDEDGALLAAAQPCGGVAVSVVSDDGDVFATASADGTGFFQVAGVPAGEYTLTLSRAGYNSHVRSIRVPPGGTVDLNPDRVSGVTVSTAEAERDFIPLGLAAPPTSCVGTVLLNIVDRRGTVGLVPVTDASGPGVIRFVETGATRVADCDEPPSVSRIGGSGTYRIDGLPIGPLDITVGDDDVPSEDLGWAYSQGSASVQVLALDPVPASVDVTARPRALTIPAGLITLAGPEGASRDVTLEVLDPDGPVVTEDGDPVEATFTISGGGANSEVTLDVITPSDDLRLAIVGGDIDSPVGDFPGYASLGGPEDRFTFAMPVGVGAFTLSPEALTDEGVDGPHTLDLTAQTRISGTVLGISADTTSVASLGDAEVTIPGVTDPVSPVSVDPADGTFSVIVDADTYGATGGTAPITVSASGHVTREFLPAPGRSLFGPEEFLRPAGDDTFLLYPTLAGSPSTLGDVGLDPKTRSVTIDATLLGGTGAEREFHFELRGGTVAGEDVSITPGTDRGTIGEPDEAQKLTADDTKTFDLGEVPVGTYTVHAVPVDGDRIALRGMSGTSGGADVTGSGPTFTLVVPPGDDPIVLSATVRARTLVEGKVFGFDLSPLQVSELAGATVNVPSSGSGATEVQGGDVMTGGGSSAGSFSFEVDSADYEEGGLGGITISADAYATRTLSGTLATNVAALPGIDTLFLLYPDLDEDPGGDVGLDPTPRDGTVSVDLSAVGGATVSRSVTVKLTGGEIAGQTITGDFVATPGDGAPSGELTTGTTGTFDFSGVPVGDYTLEISGEGIRDKSVEGITISPSTTDFDLAPVASPLTVVARTELTLTVRGVKGMGGALADAPLDDIDVVFGAALAASSDPDDAASGSSTTSTTDDDGQVTVWVDAGGHAAGAITVAATGGYESFASLTETFDEEPAGSLSEARTYTLDPAPQNVSGTIDMAGPAGVKRDVTVELWPQGTSDFSDTGDRIEAVTLEVEAAKAKPFSIADVEVGVYEVRVTGAEPSPFQVTTVTRPETVAPSSSSFALGTFEVTARTRLTLTATGIQRDGSDEALTGDNAPLEDVAVDIPAAGSPDVVAGGAAATEADGTLVVDLDAGSYSTGELGAIGLTLGGYLPDSISGALTSVTETRDVILDPSDTTFTVALALTGEAGAERTVTLEVCAAAACEAGDDPVLTETDLELTVGASTTFTSSAELEVGVYTFRVSGDDVETQTVARVIGPAESAFLVSSISARATVEVSGTVVEEATTGDPDESFRALDTTLALDGVTVTPSAAGVPAGAPATVDTDATGAFSVTLLSGEDVALSFARANFTLADVTVTVGKDATQPEGIFTMVRGAAGIRIEGETSPSIAQVTASAVGEDDVVAVVEGSRYALDLKVGPVWTIDFEDSDEEVLVSRYVQSDVAIAIVLDQDAELDDVGAITVTLEVGQDPSGAAGQTRSVRVTLTESVPSEFFTIPGGELVETVTVIAPSVGDGGTLDDVMTGDVTFSGLAVVGSSPSIPSDRFTLEVEVLDDGADPDEAYQWEQDAEADAGTAELVGFELPRTAGSAATVTKLFRFVRAPSAVRNLEAAVKDPDNSVAAQTVVLTWEAPAGNGGAASLRYDVTQDSSTVADCENLTDLTCTVGDLDDGTEYEFTVIARNLEVADLSSSKAISATPRDVPGAPTIISASSNEGEGGGVIISWTAPTVDGGADIIDYTVTSSTSSDDGPSCTSNETTCTITGGFDEGTAYTFTVTARNAAGSSDPSDPSDPPVAISFTDSMLSEFEEGTTYAVERQPSGVSSKSDERGWFFQVQTEVTVDGLSGGGSGGSGGSWQVLLREGGQTTEPPAEEQSIIGWVVVGVESCAISTLPSDDIRSGSLPEGSISVGDGEAGTVQLQPGRWYSVTARRNGTTGITDHCVLSSNPSSVAFGAAGTSQRVYGNVDSRVAVGFRVATVP